MYAGEDTGRIKCFEELYVSAQQANSYNGRGQGWLKKSGRTDGKNFCRGNLAHKNKSKKLFDIIKAFDSSA